MNQSEPVAFSLDDLRLESFDTLPELSEGALKAVEDCYPICETGETIVCCYPTLGNGTAPPPCSLFHCSIE